MSVDQRLLDEYNANPNHCAHCGKVLPYGKRKQTYCSAECRLAPKQRSEEDIATSKANRKEYLRQYRKDHAEKHREQSLTYYNNNKEKVRAQQAVYRSAHREDKAAYDAHRRSIRRTCQKCGQWFYEEDDTIKYCPSCREQN